MVIIKNIKIKRDRKKKLNNGLFNFFNLVQYGRGA